jgi:chromosome segregation ATPase
MPVQPAAPPPYQAPPASTGPNLSALKASIERSQATLGELDREITQYEQQLASDNSRLDNFKKSLDALDSQSAAGGNVDASYYNSLVDQHNLLLAASKDRLARRNAVAKRYNALLVSTNADIDRYNKAVMGY